MVVVIKAAVVAVGLVDFVKGVGEGLVQAVVISESDLDIGRTHGFVIVVSQVMKKDSKRVVGSLSGVRERGPTQRTPGPLVALSVPMQGRTRSVQAIGCAGVVKEGAARSGGGEARSVVTHYAGVLRSCVEKAAGDWHKKEVRFGGVPCSVVVKRGVGHAMQVLQV